MAKIGSQARMVMAALEGGQRLTRMGEDWRAGALIATAATVKELQRHDLVQVDGDVVRPTSAGAGFTVRSGEPDEASRRIAERVAAGTRRRVRVNEGESPLGWLKARKLLSDRQFLAGERLRADWTMAGLSPRVTMRWDASGVRHSGGGEGMDATMAQVAAKRRHDEAVAAIGGGLRDVAWRVICAGEGLELAEQALGWPRRAGKVVLLLALDRLADHYRIN